MGYLIIDHLSITNIANREPRQGGGEVDCSSRHYGVIKESNLSFIKKMVKINNLHHFLVLTTCCVLPFSKI